LNRRFCQVKLAQAVEIQWLKTTVSTCHTTFLKLRNRTTSVLTLMAAR
jgi:hypothetical protein